MGGGRKMATPRKWGVWVNRDQNVLTSYGTGVDNVRLMLPFLIRYMYVTSDLCQDLNSSDRESPVHRRADF